MKVAGLPVPTVYSKRLPTPRSHKGKIAIIAHSLQQKELLSLLLVCCVPQRYILAVMAFLAILNAYGMRVCLNVAITEMVVKKPHRVAVNESIENLEEACPEEIKEHVITDDNHTISKSLNNTELFDWSEREQGLILSSFYWGYVITHLPGGMYSDRFGGKHSLGIGILLTAIFTFLIPVAARGGQNWLLFTRFLTGLGEGTTFPAVANLLAKWVPPHERSFLGSFVFTAAQMGTVFANLLTAGLLTWYPGQWPIVFYVFGGIGVAWFLAWCLLGSNDPNSHPFITEKEKRYLNETIVPKEAPPIPWRQILTSTPVIALIITQMGHDWALFTMVTDLPKFMKDVLKLSIGATGLFSALPFLLTWIVSCVSGYICDLLIRRSFTSIATARKLCTGVAHIGVSIGVVGASYAGCNIIAVVGLFCLGMATMGFYYPGTRVNVLDLSPNFSGIVFALVNGIGASSGIVTPYLVGVLTPNRSGNEWRMVFWITAAVNIITLVIFVIFCSGEIQPWNDVSISNSGDGTELEQEENVDRRGTENSRKPRPK